jgi:hypothetical protein
VKELNASAVSIAFTITTFPLTCSTSLQSLSHKETQVHQLLNHPILPVICPEALFAFLASARSFICCWHSCPSIALPIDRKQQLGFRFHSNLYHNNLEPSISLSFGII